MMGEEMIPLNRPTMVELDSMRWEASDFSSDGTAAQEINRIFREVLGVGMSLLTPSGTAALELTALLLGLGPEDEVIVPAYTFVSTANAYLLRGARIVFADIRRDTFNIDERLLPERVTSRTKAVVVVHYAGHACAMDEICSLSEERRFVVIEDNAHGLFASYKGRYLGSLAPLAAQSFHSTKNFQCGEGGALFVNQKCYEEEAEILREKGTDRGRFLRGEVDRYTWRSMGSSFLLAEPLARILLAQIQRRREILEKRREHWEYYQRNLRDWARANGVQLPIILPECRINYHLFSLLMPDKDSRDRLMKHLEERGIQSATHYPPLPITPMGRTLGGKPGQCPVAEEVYDRLLRLPFFTSLTNEERERVVEAVREF